MNSLRSLLRRLRRDESGVSLVEWTVMAALIGGVAVAAMINFDTAMEGAVDNLETCITAPSSTNCDSPA